MTLRGRFQNWLDSRWFRLGVRWYTLKQRYRVWRFGPPPPPDPKTLAMIQALSKALEAGNYDAAPTEMKQGCDCYTSAPLKHGQSLKIEDLSAVMACVTYDGPRPWPKWWEVWKLWNPRYMAELRAQRERTSLQFGRFRGISE